MEQPGGFQMPDPLAGLPSRYLHTPEAARFLVFPAELWRNTATKALGEIPQN